MTRPDNGYGTTGAPPTTSGKKNVFGLVSLISGAAATVIGLLFRLVEAAIIGSEEFDLLPISSGVEFLLTGLLALAAVGLGIAGLLRKGLPRSAAAAGTALGAASLVGILGALLYTLTISVLVR